MRSSEALEDTSAKSELPWPAAVLRNAGIEVIGYIDDPALAEPLVRFSGDRSEGWRALTTAMKAGLCVGELRRVWQVSEGEPTGPWWELTVQVAHDPVQSNDNRNDPSETGGARAAEQDRRARR